MSARTLFHPSVKHSLILATMGKKVTKFECGETRAMFPASPGSISWYNLYTCLWFAKHFFRKKKFPRSYWQAIVVILSSSVA